jgi:hypothetical protein
MQDDLQCGGVSGGFWPFGSLGAWCAVIRYALFKVGY